MSLKTTSEEKQVNLTCDCGAQSITFEIAITEGEIPKVICTECGEEYDLDLAREIMAEVKKEE